MRKVLQFTCVFCGKEYERSFNQMQYRRFLKDLCHVCNKEDYLCPDSHLDLSFCWECTDEGRRQVLRENYPKAKESTLEKELNKERKVDFELWGREK